MPQSIDQLLTLATRLQSSFPEYRYESFESGRDKHHVLTHPDALTDRRIPSGQVAQFRFIESRGRVLFEIDDLTFEPGKVFAAQSQIIEFARAYIAARVKVTRRRPKRI